MDFEQWSRLEIGTLLRQLREEANLTQNELANKIGVSNSTISNVEHAKGNRASKQTMKRLFKAVGVSWERIPQLLKKEQGKKDKFFQMIQLKLTSIENKLDYGYLKEGKKELKELEVELKDHPYLAIVHYLKGKYFFRHGKDNWPKAFTCFQDAISNCSIYSELRSSNIEAACYYELSRIYSRSNNYQEALTCVENGLQALVPKGERKSTKYVLLISKIIYLEKLERNGEVRSVLDYMRKFEGELDTETKLNMYQSEVNLLYREKVYDLAILKAKQALDIARREKNYDRSFEMWTALGSIYKDLGYLEMAKVCFQTASQWENKIKEANLAAYNATELGKLHCQIKDIAVAESYLQNAVELSKTANDAFYHYEALSALSELWLQHGRGEDGICMLENAYQLARKHALYTQEKNAALKLTEFYRDTDRRKYQDYLTLFYEISVKLSSNGGEEEMPYEDLKRRAGNPPDN